MRIGICIPDSGPLAEDLLRKLVAFGFDHARVDVHPDDHERNWAQIRSFHAAPELLPIFLLAPGTMRRTSGRAWTPKELADHTRDFCIKLRQYGFLDDGAVKCALEIGNEPDIAAKPFKQNPNETAEIFADCWSIVRQFSDTVPVLCPSISNLDEDSLDYLDMMSPALPADCVIAFHRYPPGKKQDQQHKGFRDRIDETEQLIAIAGGREMWCTETGVSEWTNGVRDKSEVEVAEWMLEETLFWHACPFVLGMTWYQINDGTTEDRLDHYGIRRLDETWKPVANRLLEVKARLS